MDRDHDPDAKLENRKDVGKGEDAMFSFLEQQVLRLYLGLPLWGSYRAQ
jgi:hypothetical protein